MIWICSSCLRNRKHDDVVHIIYYVEIENCIFMAISLHTDESWKEKFRSRLDEQQSQKRSM